MFRGPDLQPEEKVFVVAVLVVVLLAVVTWAVLVVVPSLDFVRERPDHDRERPDQFGAPAGYVSCDATYPLGKGEEECPTPAPTTPKEDIVYCRGTSRANVNTDDCYSTHSGE